MNPDVQAHRTGSEIATSFSRGLICRERHILCLMLSGHLIQKGDSIAPVIPFLLLRSLEHSMDKELER